jgi:hypothetical protein
VTEWLRGDLVIAGGALASALLVMNGAVAFWTITRLRELRQVRERMSRLADGLALLTDTTEAGLATVIREVEHLSKRPAAARATSRSSVARRVSSAAKRGRPVAEIAAAEAISESEVRLHLAMSSPRTAALDQSAAAPQA